MSGLEDWEDEEPGSSSELGSDSGIELGSEDSSCELSGAEVSGGSEELSEGSEEVSPAPSCTPSHIPGILPLV